MTTTAATGLTTSSAVLNGTGVPNGEATTGWFRYSTTNPVTCNDTFGIRVPAASGTDLGSGVASVPYSITTTGLTSGTTYYFCAIVSNASGTGFGAVLSFTIPSAPVVTTNAATSVTSGGATLQGSANPVGSSSTGWFRYSLTDPGTCNDTFGTRAPASGGATLGSGTSAVSYTQGISSLLPGTTYYYCAIANNSYGTAFGSPVSFTTSPMAPSVTTNSLTMLTGTTAQFNGTANPNGAATTGWFRYSTSSPGSCNDTFGTRAPASGGSSLGSGTTGVSYSQAITGLTASTTYYMCAIASNSVGTSFGSIISFTTPAPPTVTTTPAGSITNTAAYLYGSANPNRASTTGYFRYGLTDPVTCNDVFGSRAPVSGGTALGSGSSAVTYYEYISGLSAGTTYYFCAIANNSEGTAFGSVLTFTTDAAPTVTTSAATSVTGSGATLNGSANPNGSDAYGHYRYSTTSPGTCNDTFGTRAPASSGSDTYLGAGSTPAPFPRSISGLTPGTTYYFCAIANNSYGTSFGTLLMFTTPATAPSVTTGTPALVTGTTATLMGNANPGGDSTTGWFRYATASPGTCNDSFGTRAPGSGGSSLGSGVTSVAYSQAITGLSPSTTYYVCAIASNSVGTSFGSVVSFTTPAPPTVTTTAAYFISDTGAYLPGEANPNRATTTGWFRYSTTDPGACSDTFGSRAPSTGGTNLGAGSSPVAYQQYVTGFSPGTTYYFCAIASNSEGMAFGSVLTFTTASAPTVTTSAATLVTGSGATLNGSANPNLSDTYGHFRYSTTSPASCNDTFGTRAPASSGSDSYLGAGTSATAYSRAISGLTPGTTYYFCAIANNGYGTSFGSLLMFTTPAAAPTVTTNSPTLLTGTTGTLNGTVNPGGDSTTGWFRYATASPGTCNDSFGTRAPTSGGSSLGSGVTSTAYSQAITGLSPSTTYYVCAIASNSVGTSFGSVLSFTTPAPPTVTTTPAGSITNTAAYLYGSANPNRAATTGWFRYSLTDPVTCNDTFGSRAPSTGGTSLGSGSSAVTYYEYVSGLSAGTTYYFCAIASNGEGMAFGSVLTFTTASAPTVTTSAATLVTGSGATLNGSAIPNGADSYGHYRYSTTSPGSCNDTFGTRAPASSGSDSYLGAGTSSTAYSRAISGLTPGTTYYFCAIANNTYGTSFGTLLMFTTPAAAPTVTTNSPTLLTGTTGTLNGTVNPGGDSTTGWFRYATASPGSCNDSFGTRAPTSGGSSLGSGVTSTAYSQAITGLSPSTTYYVCAIASNSVGTAFGSVLSFTTPAPPTVTTTPAGSITNTAAYLYGSANPNRAATTGWFRYSLTDPVTCNDTFGSRAPLSGGTSLGSGSSAVTYYEYVSGLSAGTTYYFCAIASNGEGMAFGSVLTFTTASAPTVTTSAATLVTSSGATLNGSAIPNGADSYGHYRYSTTSPGSCNDTFGTRAPASSFSDSYLGAGTTSAPFPRAISGLTPGTTYYFCAISNNTYGTSFGAVLMFTTPAAAPAVTTNSPTLVTGATATLNGTVNPGGDATTGWFRYSTSSPGSCNDSFGTRAPTSGGSSLGSGVTSTSYSQAITGLTQSTTYYVCAIASNSVGTTFGSVISFTTPAPPIVTTTPAGSITNTTAYLYGSANPNRASTTGYFRYSTTDPGACSDTFGSRAPLSGGTALGSGSSAVTYYEYVSGLSAGTTYYFCAIATNGEGTSFGSVLTFTTLAPPTVTTSAATLVTSSGATLNGSANPNGDGAYGHFRYSTTSPGSCNDTFGTRAPASSGSDTWLGAGTAAVPFSRVISGLTPGTTYYACAIANNAYGTSFGAILSFTTPATAPVVTTSSPSALTPTTATFNGSANPGGDATTGWFRYATASPGSCNDSFGTRAPATGGSTLGSGVSSVSYNQAVTGLTPGTTYYVCAIASNSIGTSFGSVLSFSTPTAPTVQTLAATPITATTATLNASANPNGNSTTGWFRYSTTSPVTCNDTFGTRVPTTGGTSLGAGTTPVNYSQALTSLSPGTTYYFCALASSVIGTTLGEVLSFTTPPTQPTVTSVAASGIGPDVAVINGTANPNGDATTGWFRYSTTSPGTCNDTFGTRTPATGGTSLGSGNAAVAYSASLSSLTAGTTYYFCAIASNSIGTGVGTVLSFTTAAAPAVTTSAATAVSSSGATLNGSADPNLSATTGWFRYDTTNPGTCNDTFGTRAPASGGTSLGSGSTAVTYSQALTGLTAATTYYFCAIASNSVGTSFGTVLTFSTAATPTVLTDVATGITGTTATLNGTANPNLSTATGWFRYSTVNPGTCNDTFGTRAPASGGTALGAGSTPVAYNRALTGLTSGTTYYYCAIASNAIGTGFGVVLAFTTAGAPTVTTDAATGVTNTAATLNGSASPNLTATTGWFRYSTVNPVTCNDTFGTRAPSSGGTSLGSGSTPVTYSQSVTGLLAGTTYYFCAIANNSLGTRFGSVLSFTTLALPAVTTSAASGVSSTAATLNGSGDPNLSAATGWFRYSTTSPGSCNDTFGTRAPASGGTSLGSGTTAVPYSEALTGLTSGTTYYFCAIASNSIGTGFGTVLSFTTPGAPAVTTSAATAVTSSGATLNGSGNPNLSATTGWFRYGTTSPGVCDDTFGTRAPASGGTSLGSGSSAVAYSQAITGLTSSTTYYYCAIASNAVGTSFGTVLSFTTAAAPTVTTDVATLVAATTATVNGTANPNLLAATGWFRYSTTNPVTCNDTFGTRSPATGGTALGSGSAPVAYSRALTGLTQGTTYYFCAIASNSAGTGFGAVLSFTTLAVPAVTTVAAAGVTNTAATLGGTANPNLSATTGWFRYSTTSPASCTDTFGTRAPATGGLVLGSGSTPVAYSLDVTTLAAGTTYYYCAIANNSVGNGFGTVLSFTTLAAPTVTTTAATGVSSTGATLNGTGDPNLSDATGWFRYSATAPASCNDTFGTRAPASGGTSLGAGSSAVAYSQALTGLSSGTTYHYCAIASNAVGTSFGTVLSFTTPGAPSVTTSAATAVTGMAATLNGSASPNLAATTGWFRYDTIDPGACDDTFGTRAPATGGSALGAGSAPVAYSQALTGLMQGTTYYYCAIASNSAGTSFGMVLSFTTPSPPTVVSDPVMTFTGTTATLSGSANPNGASTTGWFRYDTVDPGACDNSFGTRAPASGGSALGAGSTPVAYSQALTGLSPATTYYFCAIASNAVGTGFGEVLSVTTLSAPPTVTTAPPTGVVADAAVLNGSANPNGDAATGWFRYSTSNPGTCNDTFGVRAPATGGTTLGAGATDVSFSEAAMGLTRGATYYYCAIAGNSQGTSFGGIETFVPGEFAPIVITNPASSVEGTGATVEGTANPNGSATTGWFRYGDFDPGICDDSFGTRAPATGGTALGSGTNGIGYSEPVTGLEPNFTYYFCAAASNLGGATFGQVLSFTTGAAPPVVRTVDVTIDGSGPGAVTLSGAADPMGSETTGWFRYDTVNPGTCSDTFGTRTPTVGGTIVGAGRDEVPFSQAVAEGLPVGTYYFCAIAANVAGLSTGEVMTFEISQTEPPGTGGCSCRTSARGSSGLPLAAVPFVAFALLALRRRRRRR